MRQHLIAANWKMYKTPAESAEFFSEFLPFVPKDHRVETVICPSMTCLPAAVHAARDSGISIGAQNMHWLPNGAYTGETSPTMLLALGCTHVLIGHSERRQYFNETDETVNLKLRAAITNGLIPIVCVGEHLAEREAGMTADVLQRQVSAALQGIDPEEASDIVFAYEPVWAIGTGRTATPEIAEEAHKMIRSLIASTLGQRFAESTRILYGGSVKPDNAGSLCCLDDVDGALVGGASLDPSSFAAIVKAADRRS